MGLTMLSAMILAAAAPALPEWMAGCWVEQGERWTEECWMAPRGGVMLGASRSGQGDRVRETENMRIDIDVAKGDGSGGSMAFSAVQRSGGWTSFTWAPGSEPGVTFVNAAHDYPQRIRYWREGETLLAEIALLDGSKARRWTYRRAAP